MTLAARQPLVDQRNQLVSLQPTLGCMLLSERRLQPQLLNPVGHRRGVTAYAARDGLDAHSRLEQPREFLGSE